MKENTINTILLVEDEVLIAMTEKMGLEKYGYSVRTVTTGEQAVKAIQTSSDIDLILMDINLGPGMDGTEAAEIILKDRDIPIVFLSSHTEPEIVEKTEKITSYGYVVKNSSLTVLDASIKMAFKLFEARRQVNDTFTHSINGLCIHRAIRDESGRLHDCEYLRVNRSFEQQAGLSSQNTIGRTIRDLYPEGDADGVIRLYNEILSGSADARQEFYFETTQRWFEISVFRTHNNEFTVAIQNITERKGAEDSLLYKNKQLRTILDTVPSYIFAKDIDGRFLLANRAVADVFGVEPDEVVGKTDFDYGATAEQSHAYNMVDRAVIESGNSLSIPEEQIMRKDGTLGWFQTVKIPYSHPGCRKPAILGVATEITERKNTEELLRRAGTILKVQQETAPYGVLVVDEDDEIVSFNQGFASLWRIPDEIMALQSGEKALAFILPQLHDPERFREEIAQLTANRQPEESREIPLTDGRTLIRYSYPMISDDECYHGRVWYYHDISESKRAEDRLKQVLREYDTVFHGTQDAMFLVDVIDEDTYRYIRNNRAHSEATGLTVKELENKTPQELLGTEMGAEIAGNYRRCVQALDCISYEETLHFPGGVKTWHTTLTPVFDEGRVKYLVGSAQDITERKQMEETLRESVNRFDELVRMIPVGVYVLWIRADGRMDFEYVSDRWCTIHKLCREEVLADAEKANNQAHPEELGAFIERNRQAARDHTPFLWEGRFIVGDGELRWLRMESTPCVFDNGDIRWFGVTQDITERKQAEEEIKRQLAEKETLLKEVHHRIKNNMAQVEGLLSIQAGSHENAIVKAVLMESVSRVQSIRALYEKLLIGTDYTNVSIKDYLESLIDSLMDVFCERPNVTVERRIADFALSQRKAVPVGIIMNELLTNVFKYAFTGRDGGLVSIALDKDETRATLTVTDDGVGIENGVDAGPNSASQGFGLSLVTMLAEQLEGTFSIESNKGTRSVVEFRV